MELLLIQHKIHLYYTKFFFHVLREVYFAHQDYIYLIKNTVKVVVL